MPKRMTNERFIQRALVTHGDKYDYSQTSYKNSRSKVEIICPKHGVFEQNAAQHLNGRGCRKCGFDAIRDNNFVERAKEIHGNKYDYSKVDYERSDKEVMIICPEHEEFKQLPYVHLRGNGCRKCTHDKLRMTTEEFVKKAREVHGGKYSYSLTRYGDDNKDPVLIVCPVHGGFYQTPNNHIRGTSCPDCMVGKSKGEQRVQAWLEAKSIKFETQKRFEDCRDIYPLPFDFFLSDRSILIEYDGRQHFESIDAWGGQKGLDITKYHDNLKSEWAAKNNYRLVRIRYDQDVELALNVGLKII